ncbi:MAG TPA: hypothetical protein RMH99_14455 [Sandaracinaceae bacterium LLY-WYZ-13_1]|nr:hypothetical protein [Sandaracinaceae bacterium LLY-WYZ-13_1]
MLAYSAGPASEPRTPPPGLRVGPAARWVEAPGGPRIDLARRPVLRRVFLALLESHARDPDASLDAATLFRAGWPDEKATPDSALNRVYVSVCRLRKLGLADYITTDESGFRLTRGPDAPSLDGSLSRRDRALIAATVAAVSHRCAATGCECQAPAAEETTLRELIRVAEAAYARALHTRNGGER